MIKFSTGALVVFLSFLISISAGCGNDSDYGMIVDDQLGTSACVEKLADEDKKDPAKIRWCSEVSKGVIIAMHKAESIRFSKNMRHVMYAYAAFMILLVLFVYGLWRRQNRLLNEVLQLEEELEKNLSAERASE